MSLMLEEILEQPAVIERTLRMEMPAAESLRKALAKHPPRFVILAARGTSDNAALFARYLIEVTTGIPVSLAAPSVFTLYQAKVDYKDALVVAISQSGESTDTNLVLERARQQGALTVGITNEPGSSLARLAEHVILVRAGREKSVAATKTYTGQLIALYLVAYALGARFRPADLDRIAAHTAAALKLAAPVAEQAIRYRFMNHAVVVGRGLNYSNAFEFALKMMETSYVVAERFSSADFLHGPIAMVESAFPVFLFTPSGVTWPTMNEMAARLSAAGAEVFLFTDRSNKEAAAAKGRRITIPAAIIHNGPLPQDIFTPIPYVVPAQLFAEALAREKGLDPDRPRMLTKVTQTL